jgi:hypothetical protein
VSRCGSLRAVVVSPRIASDSGTIVTISHIRRLTRPRHGSGAKPDSSPISRGCFHDSHPAPHSGARRSGR